MVAYSILVESLNSLQLYSNQSVQFICTSSEYEYFSCIVGCNCILDIFYSSRGGGGGEFINHPLLSLCWHTNQFVAKHRLFIIFITSIMLSYMGPWRGTWLGGLLKVSVCPPTTPQLMWIKRKLCASLRLWHLLQIKLQSSQCLLLPYDIPISDNKSLV